MSYFEDVKAFHEKFGLDYNGPARHLAEAELQFRLNFIEEELTETHNALRRQDLHEVADGIVDTIWVLCGLAARMGIPLDACWQEVVRANMAKERAADASQSKRGSALDIIKPPGWKGPDHWPALLAAGAAPLGTYNEGSEA